ncbi:MAG: helix-turn-helix domain-containing protein [Intrasporangium sp.]|uniref:PucR family transcriptional regulator n=1 Tax=Intrasporangium sp. TaxID=1925024 RepID=UPI0026480839|nr:PucR family transcriptional regulator [Intrasporangium sp.]MDN5796140.1 helix-turn-helix domain-containing protein [Intrasporangium sp.]
MSEERRTSPTPATARAVDRSTSILTAAATAGMEQHSWYRRLTAEERSWVGLVVGAGIAEFIAWFRAHGNLAPSADLIFGNAPRELTRSVSLRQTIDLIRTVVDVVEAHVDELAEPGDEAPLRESVLVFSREIAFEVAEIYADAAEARGAWDARLEALVVDAVLRGEADASMQSRATALGWGSVAQVTFVVGAAPESDTGPAVAVDAIRRALRRGRVEALAIVQRRHLMVILGGTGRPGQIVADIADHFGDGPIVVGPTVPHLFAAGRSARAALSGLDAAPAWPAAPRIVESDALLPERALAGDQRARRILVDRIHKPLAQPAQAPLLETAAAYLDQGGSLEATARSLFVHPNTVRYRLGRISDLIDYDLATPREAWAVRIALALGTLNAPEPAAPRHLRPAVLEETSKG